MANKLLKYAALAVLALGLALGFGAHSGNARPPQAAAPGSGKLPDVLGITTGMLAQQALDIMRAHDVGHTVDYVRITIPQLYGNRPVMSSMNTPYTGTDVIYVMLTMPPLQQRVYTVSRTVHVMASQAAIVNELLQKYGTHVSDQFFRPIPQPQNAAGFRWLFDETGQVVDPPNQTDKLKMQNCINSTGTIWGTGAPASNTVRDDVIQQNPRTAVVPVNPLFDPAVPHLCDNLVVVHAAIGGAAPNFTLEVDITDVTIQHRAAKVWNDQLNAIVQKGSQQQINNASQQSLPKF